MDGDTQDQGLLGFFQSTVYDPLLYVPAYLRLTLNLVDKRSLKCV